MNVEEKKRRVFSFFVVLISREIGSGRQGRSIYEKEIKEMGIERRGRVSSKVGPVGHSVGSGLLQFKREIRARRLDSDLAL